MSIILPRRFYLDSPEVVARELLGKLVTSQLDEERLTGRIIEVEAYLGITDAASHTFRGRTERNAMLFGPPGFSYVYFVYGIYYCLNVSCLPDGMPGGVLIRSLEPIEGLKTMAKLRGFADQIKPEMLASGPGRLCQAMGITRAKHNDLDVTNASSPLQILSDGFRPSSIKATPRVGVSRATDKALRFVARADKLS